MPGSRKCEVCWGSGKVDDPDCNNGNVKCTCDNGYKDGKPHYVCSGTGKVAHPKCSGTGKIKCSNCGGDGWVEW